MAAGARSLQAFWMGGAGSAPAAVNAGARSMLAHWMGGAGSAAPVANGGVRGMLGFWAGGFAAGPAIEPPTPQQETFSGGWFDFPDDGPRRRRLRDLEDERNIAPTSEQESVSFSLGSRVGANVLRQMLRSKQGLTNDSRAAIDAAADDELQVILVMLMAMDD
jgi:hypothetical protein